MKHLLPRAVWPAALVLALAAPATAEGTEASGWRLVSVAGLEALPGGRIAFSADGAVFGSTGCNRFTGTVVAAPGMLDFNRPLASTRKACPGDLEEQERRVLEALSGPVSVAYDPVSDRMTLVPANGHAVLAFERDP
ncbi:MAG: META domain-containing protein [Alphaproteobacteria bacterium]|nr:MAG: META domain-containing protein [Alphaproteobacteria bacterium]